MTRMPDKKELLELLNTAEKLTIKIISIVGWVKILVDVKIIFKMVEIMGLLFFLFYLISSIIMNVVK